jgi:hypothetical protein
LAVAPVVVVAVVVQVALAVALVALAVVVVALPDLPRAELRSIPLVRFKPQLSPQDPLR